jgi:hypothetical protein
VSTAAQAATPRGRAAHSRPAPYTAKTRRAPRAAPRGVWGGGGPPHPPSDADQPDTPQGACDVGGGVPHAHPPSAEGLHTSRRGSAGESSLRTSSHAAQTLVSIPSLCSRDKHSMLVNCSCDNQLHIHTQHMLPNNLNNSNEIDSTLIVWRTSKSYCQRRVSIDLSDKGRAGVSFSKLPTAKMPLLLVFWGQSGNREFFLQTPHRKTRYSSAVIT